MYMCYNTVRTYTICNTHVCMYVCDKLYIIASEASFLVRSMALNFAIYIFQVDHHSVNVLNVSTCI